MLGLRGSTCVPSMASTSTLCRTFEMLSSNLVLYGGSFETVPCNRRLPQSAFFKGGGLNPGERYLRDTRDDGTPGTVTLCTLRAATVLSRDCRADFGRPLRKKVISHSRDGPGVTAPLRTNVVPLTGVSSPFRNPPLKSPRPKKVLSNPRNGSIEPLRRFYQSPKSSIEPPLGPPRGSIELHWNGLLKPQAGFYRALCHRSPPPPSGYPFNTLLWWFPLVSLNPLESQMPRRSVFSFWDRSGCSDLPFL